MMDEPSLDKRTAIDLLSLPTELIQDIAWLSFNLNLYLVSQGLRHRLCPQRDYIRDLAYLLLCDRRGVESAWSSTSVPWRTSPARRWNLNLLEYEREEIQRRVCDLETITAVHLVSMIQFILQSWIRINAPFVDGLPAGERERIRMYLGKAENPCFQTDTRNFKQCHQDHLIENELGHRLLLSARGLLAVSSFDAPLKPRYVVHVLYVPTRLLRGERELGREDLSRTLLLRTRMDSLNHLIVKKHSATARPKWMEL